MEFARRLADESTRLGSPIDFFLLAGTPTLLDHSANTNGTARVLCTVLCYVAWCVCVCKFVRV